MLLEVSMSLTVFKQKLSVEMQREEVRWLLAGLLRWWFSFLPREKNVHAEIPLPLAKELNWLLKIMKLEVGYLKWKAPNWKHWADRPTDGNSVVFFTDFFSWDSYCQVTLNFRYFRKASSLRPRILESTPNLNQEPLLYPQYSCCCYQYPSPLLVESSPGAHHCQTAPQHQSSGHYLPVLTSSPVYSHISLALFCWLPLHSGSQRYTCKQQEGFRLYSYPHMCVHRPLFICEETEYLGDSLFLCRGIL